VRRSTCDSRELTSAERRADGRRSGRAGGGERGRRAKKPIVGISVSEKEHLCLDYHSVRDGLSFPSKRTKIVFVEQSLLDGRCFSMVNESRIEKILASARILNRNSGAAHDARWHSYEKSVPIHKRSQS
jgi:hypothetical protein